MADQQKATSLPLYGNPDVRAPYLQALAARGVVARTCFTAHPFCLPSRAALMTGRYAHATGMRGNGSSWAPDEVPLAEILRGAGYRTGAVGHFHGGRSGGDRGFEYAKEMTKEDQGAAWRRHAELVHAAPARTAHMTATVPGPADADVDAVMTRDALAFLDSVGDDEPFFLHVAWIAPHPPYQAPAPYDTLYDPAALRYPTQESAAQREGKPAAYWETARDMGTLDAPEDGLCRALATYYGMCTLLDDQVGRLVGYLERRGLLENTIVVYTADHGDYAGEHGMWGKSCTLYDCLVRVPLIVAGAPDLVPAGRELEGMVQTIDVMPTVLELVGLPVPQNAHGLSLRRLWSGEPQVVREHLRAGRVDFDVAFAEVGAFPPDRVGAANRVLGDNVPNGPPATGRQTELSVMARTAEWKLVYTPGREVQELYNVREDPGELENLLAPESTQTRFSERLIERVEEHLRTRILNWLLAHV